METSREPLEALRDIRNMMERSSRFLSLSGLAGVIIGLYALAGVAALYLYTGISPLEPGYPGQARDLQNEENHPFVFFLISDAALVLFAALLTGSWMAKRKANKLQLPIWDATAKRLLINMLIPLITGGLFSLILLYRGQFELLAPVTLLFYGLALVNASKYSIDIIRTLGVLEIIVGLLACLFIEYGLLFWAAGFGILHIIYGIAIYSKYEK